jgi:hypothetical protein
MTRLLAALLALTVVGCVSERSPRVSGQTLESSFTGNISVVVVDSCEYVFVKSGYGGGLAHKGNCKNHEVPR